MVNSQAPATFGGSLDICILAVDILVYLATSLLRLNDAHCMEVGKRGKKSPFQPSPYNPRMLMFATSDKDLD